MGQKLVAVAVVVVGLGATALWAAPLVTADVSEAARSELLLRGNDARAEAARQIARLVHQRFSGDWRAAFAHYASRGGSAHELERVELSVVLEDANIGNLASRGFWADRILDEIDVSASDSISWDEFERVYNHHPR